ncbi:MAG: DNA-binding response regulator [Chloroflexi bacterium RBG_13_46_9]|nr:MAG: DNA-binding response regulator [Chloroflexi bacterium RBG_13_46_9]
MSNKILLVEDDHNLLETIKYNLLKEGYEALAAVDGAEALDIARQQKPDLIILDIMLPKIDGFEVCRILRKEMRIPIIILTARADETDRIIGLDTGADDYMTKPFSIRELLARIRALLRRSKMAETKYPEGQQNLILGDITIDLNRHLVTVKEHPLELTAKEYDLLVFLVKNQGYVFSREQLLEKVWGYDFAGDTRTVDVHIRWLRQKIETDPANPRHLLTVRGTGYKIER